MAETCGHTRHQKAADGIRLGYDGTGWVRCFEPVGPAANGVQAPVMTDLRAGGPVAAGQQTPTVGLPRPTATIQNLDGEPLDRDVYAAMLEEEWDHGQQEPPGAASLSHSEAHAIAQLLDELMGVYPGEAMGRLARRCAVALYDMLGL